MSIKFLIPLTIRLTSEENTSLEAGTVIYISPLHISAVIPSEGGSDVLVVSGIVYPVSESPQNINEMLENL